MFYVQDNEGEYHGFDNAKEAVEAYSREMNGITAKRQQHIPFQAPDVGIFIAKEPLENKPLKQAMQEEYWIGLSCMNKWEHYSNAMYDVIYGPTHNHLVDEIKTWNIKQLPNDGMTLMSELDKIGLRTRGFGWEDKYAMYLAQDLIDYAYKHNIRDVFRTNLVDWENNPNEKVFEHCSRVVDNTYVDEDIDQETEAVGEYKNFMLTDFAHNYIKTALAITEDIAKHTNSITLPSVKNMEWTDAEKASMNRDYARFIQKTGEVAIKLGLGINPIAQAKSLKYLDGYNWKFVEENLPNYSTSKEIMFLQDSLLPRLEDRHTFEKLSPHELVGMSEEGNAKEIIDFTSYAFKNAIVAVQEKGGYVTANVREFNEYLSNVSNKLDDEKQRKVQQEIQLEKEGGLYGYLNKKYPSQRWDKNTIDTIEYWAKQGGELDISTKEALDQLLPAEIADAAINAIVAEKDGLELEEPGQESYLGYTLKELNQRQKVAEKFARDYAVMPDPSQEPQKVYNAFISTLKKEQHKDNSKGVVDTARKIMDGLSPAQKQCVGNILKEKGGKTKKAIEKILTREISTTSRKKNKEEDRGR